MNSPVLKKFLIALCGAVDKPGDVGILSMDLQPVLFNSFAKEVVEVFSPQQPATVYRSVKQALDAYNDILNPMKTWIWHDSDEGVDYSVSGYHGMLNRLLSAGYTHNFDAASHLEAGFEVRSENTATGQLLLLETDDDGLEFNLANCKVLAETRVGASVMTERVGR